MIRDIEGLIEEYSLWIKKQIVLQEFDGYVEITTPFIDRHNDLIQIYARPEGDGHILTDRGCTIDDLLMGGFSLDSEKRRVLLDYILAGFGVSIDKHNNALFVHTNHKNFCLNKHSLVQAILTVNDLFYLSKPSIRSLFHKDIAEWFDRNNVKFKSRNKISGKSGYEHTIDFIIPETTKSPIRYVKATNNCDKDAVDKIVISCIDTIEQRPKESAFYAFVNDKGPTISPKFKNALGNYDIKCISWGTRNEFVEYFAA